MLNRPTPRQSAYSDFLGIRASSKDTKNSISGRIGSRVDEISEGDVELFCPHCGESVHLTYTRRRFCDTCHKPFFFFRGKLLTEEEAARVHNPFTKEDVKTFRQKYRSKTSSGRGTHAKNYQLERFKRLKPTLECTECGYPVGNSVVKPEKYWICPECAAISVFDLKTGLFLPRDEYEIRQHERET
ncbi:MAG: hypothetical protein Q4C70_06215 [Planctomycetia bacterium]|nr:hypothetical protein [Planctomycetia bacterium]